MEIEIYKMTYKIGNTSNKLRILGKDFIQNNSNKGKLNINNKKISLYNAFSINYTKQSKIKLILNRDIFNKGCMFKNCQELESLLLISNNGNKDYINDIINEDDNEYSSYIGNKEFINLMNCSDFNDDEDSSFYNYSSSINSEIKKNEKNKLDNKIILYFYDELKYLGSNYATLTEMFYNCESLSSLPDISKWNINNVIDISSMFYNCKSLLNLPDISI